MKPLNRSMAASQAPRPACEPPSYAKPEYQPEPSRAEPEPAPPARAVPLDQHPNAYYPAPEPAAAYEPPSYAKPTPEPSASFESPSYEKPARGPRPEPAYDGPELQSEPEPSYAKPDPAQEPPGYPEHDQVPEPAPWPMPTFRGEQREAAPVASASAQREPEPEREPEPAHEPPKKSRKQKRAEKREEKERARREKREHRKGDPRRRLTVMCGVCAAVAVAAVGVGGWQVSSALEIRDMFEGNLVRVAVAASDVEAGEVIGADDVELALVPGAYVPDDYSDELGDVVGLRANSDLTAGVPISLSTLQASSEPASLASAPEEGKVAYMMSLGTAEAASPLLHVGDRVDVIVGGNGAAASVAVSSARVLALDGALEGSSDGYSTVTIELTREQATALYDLVEVGGGVPHLAVVSTSAEEGA